VMCPLNSYTLAAMDFWLRRGVSDEHIRSDLVQITGTLNCTRFCLMKNVIGVMAILLLFRFLTPAAGAATNGSTMPDPVQAMELLDNHQKLGPGDRITYRVIEDQDEPRALTITDSGDLEVPYLGLVHAAGRTSFELAKEVKVQLEQKLYYQATVIIAVELVNKTRVTGKVYVTGQVRNKGGYEIPLERPSP